MYRYLDETTFNDGAITALSNSAIDHLVSLRALSNTLQHLPLFLLFFLFPSIVHVIFFFLQAVYLYSAVFFFFFLILSLST